MKKEGRQDLILKYIVEDFIQTATPVGSQNILLKHRSELGDICPATVRNAMAGLEKRGLIEKTHTSSGRVPSTDGYRYYLEHLSGDKSTPHKNRESDFEKEFALAFRSKTRSVEDTIGQACKILSEVTSLATVVLGENGSNEELVSVSCVPVSDKTATVILVTSLGNVESKTFTVPKGASIQAISYGMTLLNDRLKGTKLCDLEKRTKALEPILKTQVGRDFQIVIQAFFEACLSFTKKKMKSYGGKKLMELPEFAGDDQFRNAVSSILGEGTPPPGDPVTAKVSPTTDVHIDPQNDISIVTKRLEFPGLPVANISVVGPTRMDYRKTLDAFQAMTKAMLSFFGFSAPESNRALEDEGEDIPVEGGDDKAKKGGAA